VRVVAAAEIEPGAKTTIIGVPVSVAADANKRAGFPMAGFLKARS